MASKMNENMIDILAASPLFKGILPETLEVMISCLRPKVANFPKNSFITVEGEEFTGVGILSAGQAAVIKENAAGVRSIMTILHAGDMFGEMVAFSASHYWPASVLAQTDCTAVFFPPGKITGECSNVCESHKQLINNMLKILSERALNLNRKVEYLSIRSMRMKIATYLLEQSRISGKKTFLVPLNRNSLADFLNVSRTALSREMGRMRDEGLIEFFRSSVKIKDFNGLIRAVE